jgi:hypothetical protein
MNKNELKKVLKPLIKECIKEVIFEEGALSTIISEVVKGTSGLVLEQRQEKIAKTTDKVLETHNETMQRIKETKMKEANSRRMLLDAIGKDSYNGVDLFEGTTPASAPRGNSAAPQGSQPLDGVDPRDPGVDISSFGMSSGIWKKLAGN